MKKIISLTLIICIISTCFIGCGAEKTDGVTIYNRSYTNFDNIYVEVKAGYFYDKHEKFVVDENTVGLTIYFTKESEDDVWS